MADEAHKLIYFAHPYGGSRAALQTAEFVFCSLQRICTGITLFAPWLTLCRRWMETVENRKLGLELSMRAVDAADGVLAVHYAGHASEGVSQEIDRAYKSKRPCFHVNFPGFRPMSTREIMPEVVLLELTSSPERLRLVRENIESFFANNNGEPESGTCLPYSF